MGRQRLALGAAAVLIGAAGIVATQSISADGKSCGSLITPEITVSACDTQFWPRLAVVVAMLVAAVVLLALSLRGRGKTDGAP